MAYGNVFIKNIFNDEMYDFYYWKTFVKWVIFMKYTFVETLGKGVKHLDFNFKF